MWFLFIYFGVVFYKGFWLCILIYVYNFVRLLDYYICEKIIVVLLEYIMGKEEY